MKISYRFFIVMMLCLGMGQVVAMKESATGVSVSLWDTASSLYGEDDRNSSSSFIFWGPCGARNFDSVSLKGSNIVGKEYRASLEFHESKSRPATQKAIKGQRGPTYKEAADQVFSSLNIESYGGYSYKVSTDKCTSSSDCVIQLSAVEKPNVARVKQVCGDPTTQEYNPAKAMMKRVAERLGVYGIDFKGGYTTMCDSVTESVNRGTEVGVLTTLDPSSAKKRRRVMSTTTELKK